jgi:hypothetical protein
MSRQKASKQLRTIITVPPAGGADGHRTPSQAGQLPTRDQVYSAQACSGVSGLEDTNADGMM